MTDQISNKDISRYYDLLDLWTRFNRGFRAYSGHESHTVHRWLVHPGSGEFSPTTTHDLLLSSGIGDTGPVSALDAGCGYGGTIFALHAALAGRWRGITISRRQLAVARRNAGRLGVGETVTFDLQSYDAPVRGSYDLVYGIESLIHSADPRHTIGNLVSVLEPGGRFVIVDDMPVEDRAREFADDVARFKKLWRAPVMPSAGEWCALLEDAGCDVVACRDLSPLLRPRSLDDIARAIEEVAARRRWRDRFGLRRVGEAETGGLLLERLNRVGAASYMMISARKRA